MAAFSVASGMNLLYDEGVLPPNAERQALAFASPAEATELGSDGLAMRTTATVLAMEDESANGTTELNPAAMQFLVQNMMTTPTIAKSSESLALPTQSAYPYGGWAPDTSSESSLTGAPAQAATSINVLA